MVCTGSLPAEWICSVVSSDSLAVYKLYSPAPLMPAEFFFMLTVSADGARILSMGRNQVDRSYILSANAGISITLA